MKTRIFVTLCLAIICRLCVAQTINVSGYVRDAATNEPLPGANVYNPTGEYGTSTDRNGYYRLNIPSGRSVLLIVSYVGYELQQKRVNSTKDMVMDILMTGGNALPDVQVLGVRHNFGIDGSQMGAMVMDIEKVKAAPALFGEVDILKTIQKMPGVQSTGDGTAGIMVRGGEYDQNLIMIDGAPIYNSEHLGGYLSAVNPDITNDIVFYRGAFPARYGGRLSSVIDMGLKEGDFEKYHGQINVGMLSSKVQAEGPLWKGHTSFNVAARASYFNWIVEPLIDRISKDDAIVPPFSHMNYYDITAKIVHRISNSDKLTASLYYGHDKNNESPTESETEYKTDQIVVGSGINAKTTPWHKEDLVLQYYNDHLFTSSTTFENRWANLVGSLFWTHFFNTETSLNVRATITTYDYKVNYSNSATDEKRKVYGKPSEYQTVSGGTYGRPKTEIVVPEQVDLIYIKGTEMNGLTSRYRNKITDVSLNSDFNWQPSQRHAIKAGLTGSYKRMSPLMDFVKSYATSTVDQPDLKYNAIRNGEYTYTNTSTDRPGHLGKAQEVVSAAAYAEDDISWTTWLRTNIGLRGSWYSVTGKQRLTLEPRVSARLLLRNNIALKAGYARMTQDVHKLSSDNITSYTDLWVPITKRVGLSTADQVSVGYVHDLTGSLSLTVEGYYKWMDNLVEYKDGGTYTSANGDWEDMVAVGKGKAYGLELLLEKKLGKTTGWVSYTWSRSLRTFDRPGMEISGGREYRSATDRPHNVNVVLTQQLGKGWDFTASWTYMSGRRKTLTNASYYSGFASGYDSESAYTGEGNLTSMPTRVNSFYERNAYKFPDTHHLDVSLNWHIDHGWGQSTLNLSVYNLYNRKNISSIYFGYENNTVVLKGICRFPIMPSLSYTLRL